MKKNPKEVSEATKVKRFETMPKTYKELYRLWWKKIKTTARGKDKISDHEVDDVVQTIFLQAIEKKWLKQYNGSCAFTTFMYTYALREIQNYINKRDSANTVSMTGARRYTPFTQMISADSPSTENLIDKLSFNSQPTSDFQFESDLNSFYEHAKTKATWSILGYVHFSDILNLLLDSYPVDKKLKNNTVITSFKGYSEKEISIKLGIDIAEVKKVETSFRVFMKDGLIKAKEFLNETFINPES